MMMVVVVSCDERSRMPRARALLQVCHLGVLRLSRRDDECDVMCASGLATQLCAG